MVTEEQTLRLCDWPTCPRCHRPRYPLEHGAWPGPYRNRRQAGELMLRCANGHLWLIREEQGE